MGTRVEQSGEFIPCAGGAGRRHLEDVADSLHRLSATAEDLQVIIPRGNRTLLLQREFRITLSESHQKLPGACMSESAEQASFEIPVDWIRWRRAGQVQLDQSGYLAFPRVDAVPGIYRFTIEDGTTNVAQYVGQAARSLRTRFSLTTSRNALPSRCPGIRAYRVGRSSGRPGNRPRRTGTGDQLRRQDAPL